MIIGYDDRSFDFVIKTPPTSFLLKKYAKIQKGSVYIETNSTIDPLVEIEYFYLTDYNKIIKVIYGDSQNITRKDNEYNFNMLIKYQPPLGFDNSLNHLTENMSIYKENYYNVKLAEMIKKKDYYLLKIDFEMKNLHNFYHRYIYVPFMIGDRFYNIKSKIINVIDTFI